MADGHSPRVTGLVVIAGVLALVVAMVLLSCESGDGLRKMASYLQVGVPATALLALFVWPRAFAANLLHAVTARVPVLVVHYLDVQNGWQTHYGKVNPDLGAMSADERLFALWMTQVSLWIPFRVLLGGGCAALGAATVRKG